MRAPAQSAILRPMSSPFRVLIIGGGFTGLTVAQELAKHAQVTLVDPNECALFTPRLVDALAGTCREADIRCPHVTLAQRCGYNFIRGTVTAVDHAVRCVTIQTNRPQTMNYDTIVFAQGAETNFFALEGREHVYPLKTWEHLLAIEERLRVVSGLAHPRIAIVGGGATGIEAAVAIHERLQALGKSAPHRTITVYQAATQILPGFLPATIAGCKRLFADLNILIQEQTAVTSAQQGGLTLETQCVVAADLVIWASGIKPNQVHSLAPKDDRGNLLPNHSLQLSPHAFAGGDTILFKDGQLTVPKNAQTAMNMGALIAKNILREHQGRPLRSYRYFSPGVMLWLGKTSTADLYHFSFTSPLFTWIRSLFYKLRWYQLTH